MSATEIGIRLAYLIVYLSDLKIQSGVPTEDLKSSLPLTCYNLTTRISMEKIYTFSQSF